MFVVDQPQPGSILGHYKIVRRLGAGGMGVVYEAEDLKLGRHVALKMLSGTPDPAALERFWREARAASALNHPGICILYEINESESQPFLVMELLEGQSLDRLYGHQAVPLNRLAELGVQIADALDAAHRKGILHRDIKPANIFVTRSGQTKILDFGLARFDDRASSDTADTRLSDRHLLTTPGSTLGTIAYMSPEQARGEPLDNRSDVFSLGVVLYEMGTGKHPFEGTTTAVVFDKLLNYIPAAPISINSELPAEFEAIVNKALEKDRDLRYQSAADLRADLRRMQRTSSASRLAASPAAVPAGSAYHGMIRASSAGTPAVPSAPSLASASQGAVSAGGSGISASRAPSTAQASVPAQRHSLLGHTRRDRVRRGLLLALTVVIVAVVAIRVLHRRRSVPAAPPQVNITAPAQPAAAPAQPPKPSAASPAPDTTSAAAVPAASSASVPTPEKAPEKAPEEHRVHHAAAKPAALATPPPVVAQPAPVVAANPAPVTPPAAHVVPAAAPPPAPHPAAFAAVSYPAHHEHAFPFLDGRSCEGTLQLTATSLIFTSKVHPVTLARSDVASISGNGVVESSGKKWRFQIDGMTNAQVHALLSKWFLSAPH